VAEEHPTGSPLWHLERLDRERRRRLRTIQRWAAYYDGTPTLAFATSKFREAFGGLLRALSDNWMSLVVSAVEERLNVSGFRFPNELEDGLPADVETLQGDRDAWYVWQANNLDGESPLAHTEVLVSSVAYALVDPTVTVGGREVPQVTIEHPEQMIVASSPANRRVREAAAKVWRDDDGRELATVYLPAGVHKYQRGRSRRWEPRQGEDAQVDNPLGVVPVVPLENRQRLLADPKAEFDSVIPLQDMCNKLMCDLIVASEFAAFMQRWVTGIELDEDEQGNVAEPFKIAIDRLLVAEDPDARFGNFAATDLGNYVKALEMVVQHIASQSSTPPHYLLGQAGSFPSGESLKSTETGLVAKVRRRQLALEPAWEEVIRLCFAAQGDARAEVLDAETIWRDPESRTEAEHTDATLKKMALGVPLPQLWEDLGYSPTQIRRFRTLAREQAFENLLTGGTPTFPAAPAAQPATPTVDVAEPVGNGVAAG
jgi:hypothetical protein